MTDTQGSPVDASAVDEAAVGQLHYDLWQARFGDPRFGHEDFTLFPPLIARADEIGDPYWRFAVRLEAAYAAMWSSTAEDTLTLIVWLLRELDRQGAGLELEDGQRHRLHVTLTDFLEDVVEMPQLTLDQCEAMLADWERRMVGTDYENPVTPVQVRARIAMHRGEPELAREILDGLDDFQPPGGSCEEGCRGEIAILYSELGLHERALELSEPDLVADGERCAFYPAEPQAALIAAWAAQGRRSEVISAAAVIHRTYGEFRNFHKVIAAVVALLRVDAFPEAYRLALAELSYVDGSYSPYTDGQRAAALAATFASAADADPDAAVLVRDAPGVPARLRPARELADELADRARTIGERFDLRNGNSVVSDSFDEMLALRATAHRDEGGTPISRRTAKELLSGTNAFALASPRRAVLCTEKLAERLDELTGRDRVRAELVVALRRQSADMPGAVAGLRAAAERAESLPGSLAAQGRLMADRLAVELGELPPEVITDRSPADPQWRALGQAAYEWTLSSGLLPGDPAASLAAVNRALGVLDAADRGELPLLDADPADHPDLVADVELLRTDLLMRRAGLTAEQGGDDRPDIDAALRAARRGHEAAVTPDGRLETAANLAWVLSVAGRQQRAEGDLHAALQLSTEALEYAHYSQRAQVLRLRAEIHALLDDLDGAYDDNEQAIAVHTVEGEDEQVDETLLDQLMVRLQRDDDPRTLIDIARPLVDRLSQRGAEMESLHAISLLGRAQVAAALPEDAVHSFTRVLDAATGDENPGYLAQIRQTRAGELMDLDRYAESFADLQAAVELYGEVDGKFEIGSALRMAAVSAHYAGDGPAAADCLGRAEQVYDELSVEHPVDYERARLDFARADITRDSDPDRAEVLFDSVIERAQAANWLALAINALHQSAALAVYRVDADPAQAELARRRIDAGLRLDPEHSGFHALADRLDGDPDDD